MGEKNPPFQEETGGNYFRNNICVGIEYDSKQLIKNLKKYNLFQAKSGKEKPIDFNDEKLKKAYIRGMIDGDGHIPMHPKDHFKYIGSLESCNYIKEYFNYSYKNNCKYIYQQDTLYTL